jgi:hypothetical protein
MVYDLTRMGERTFEDMCRALAVHVLGPDVQAFGDGPDGGREASFEGRLRYPDPAVDRPWNGFGVLQCETRCVGPPTIRLQRLSTTMILVAGLDLLSMILIGCCRAGPGS